MRANFVALALLIAIAVVWCAQSVDKAERSTGNDLVGYLDASRALYAKQDPYRIADRFPYIYPLFLATIVRPLTWLPVRTASVLWYVLQWGCLLYVLHSARLRIRGRELAGVSAIAIVVAVFGDVLQIEFLNGQVNLIVVALVVASVWLADRRTVVAPALLGAAMAIKLTPALLVVYWIVRRRFAYAAQAVGWAVLFVLVPWLVVGNRLWTLYADYVQHFVLARTRSADPHGGEIFFSVYGFLGWLASAPPGRGLVVASALAVLAAVAAWHLGVRSRFSGAGRGQISIFSTRDIRKSRSDPKDPLAPQAEALGAAVAWVYLAATPLLTPISEVHHLTALLPLAPVTGIAGLPFALFLWIGRFDRRGPWYFLAVLSIVIAGCLAIRRRARGAD